MEEKRRRAVEAYLNESFLGSAGARPLRILSEYLEPKSRFDHYRIEDTIVFMGSARFVAREQAEAELKEAERGGGDLGQARQRLEMSHYYEAARELARQLTDWSKGLDDQERRFVVCTGGGPGIMEAANRGALDAGGKTIGLNIGLPFEQQPNPYITPGLSLEFRYFFMRKFWFAYLAKAMVVFPGGFGTMDELFELLTLVQTRKLVKEMDIILYGRKFWEEVVNFEAMVRHGVISPEDLKLFQWADDPDTAFAILQSGLMRHYVLRPGAPGAPAEEESPAIAKSRVSKWKSRGL